MKKQKTTQSSHVKKRYGHHKKQTHSYKKIYWPYLPMLIALFVVLVMGSYQPLQIGRVLGQNNGIDTSSLLTQTNLERQKQGFQPLDINPKLTQAAQSKAIDMSKKDYWSHKTPDGQEPWVFIDNTDYAYQKAGENLAYGFTSSEGTIAGWMQSQTHRQNMLDQNYSQVGFGVTQADKFQNSTNETIVVAFYAKPSNSQATIQGASTALSIPSDSNNVAYVNILARNNNPVITLAIGVITGLAASFLIFKHGLRLKKIVTSGEHFVMHHPAVDLGITALVVVGALLLQSVGFVG